MAGPVATPPAERSDRSAEAPVTVLDPAADATPRPAERERVVRVFVSSTFKDMVKERDILMAHTWPALRRLCRERAVEFVEVDLRWGITEEQSRRKETVQYCLAEIRRCRPYFIGLLGERYGWVPPPEAFPQPLLEEQGWLLSEIARRRPTELEILHGVLNDPDMAGRAFFYFRDPAYAQARGGDFLAEDAESAGRQRDLKARIRAACRDHTITLREGDRYGDPERLAALVLADLSTAIQAEFPTEQVPDVWAREDRDHDAYAKSRQTGYYIGRDACFARLDAYVRDGAAGCGLAILGESGGGKSALLANWVGRWRASHREAFLFQHYIGSSPLSAGHLGLMRRLMVASVRWCGDRVGSLTSQEARIPIQTEEILKVFPEYLGRLACEAKRRSVLALIVLDGLNQLEDCERGRWLGWLPYRFPPDLRLIVSTLPGDTLDALAPRAWPSLTVEPLRSEERIALIARYLRHFSRGLSDQRTGVIAQAQACTNPLYLTTLLDDLRATGVNRRLDAQIADYLEAPDIPALLVKVLARYEDDYERDRPGLVGTALSLVWAARRGLTESELLAALKPAGKDQLPTAFWSPIRIALGDALVDRGGVLAFAHEHLRRAVERRYVPDPDLKGAARLRLADWFEAQPVTARSCDELPWLLEQTASFARLRACVLDIERFLLIQGRDQNELLRYWVRLGEERTMGAPYLESFMRWERANGAGGSGSGISLAANQLGYFLNHAGLFSAAEPLVRRALEGSERALGPAHPDSLASLNNLAALLQAKGDLSGAEPLYRRALDVCVRTLGPAHPDTLGSLSNLASLLYAKGDLAGAEPLYLRVPGERERGLGPAHPATLGSLDNLALLRYAKGELAGAEPLLRRALEGSERTLGPAYPDTFERLSNLAGLLQAKGDLAGAESLRRRALAGLDRALGPDHPHTLRGLNNLACLLQDKGDLAGAEGLYRRALEGRERALLPTHPSTLASLNNLAVMLQAQGDLAGAEPLFRRTLAGREQALGRAHPDTLGSYNNLAYLLRLKGDLAGAEPLYRRALEGQERVLGRAHLATLTSLQNLADLLEQAGRPLEAKPLRRRRIQAIRAKADTPPLEVRTAALDAYRLGDYALAQTLLERNLAQGFEPPGTRGHLARIALVTGDYAGAADHAAQGWAHRAAAPPYVIPRNLWLQLAARLLGGGASAQPDCEPQRLLGRLKTGIM